MAKAKRRALRLETIVEAFAEVERLAEAERAGRLVRNGSWTLGQALGHVATWSDFAYLGYPEALGNPPWIVKIVAKLLKGRFLNKGMPAGMRLPKIEGGTLGIEAISTEEGVRRFREAFGRLGREAPTHANPCLGVLPREEAVKLNLRHAELHLSFLDVG